jgi:phage-related baseplate assembly protein
MKKRGVIRETGDGRLWLDEAAAEADAATRRRVAIAAMLLAVIGIAVAYLLNGRGG